jgi:hypothetical protein
MGVRRSGWGGELVAIFHKPLAVANGASSTSTICIDLRATDLDDAMAYIKKACNSIAKEVTDGEAPERKAADDGDGGWLPPKEVGLFKNVDPVYGEQDQAAHVWRRWRPAGNYLKRGTLRRMRWWQRRSWNRLSAPSKKRECKHGRNKSQCKDCGTGNCTHGRQKAQCKDCGTGNCTHGDRAE